ncbi:MAG: hypothetical protein KKB62_02590 [Nanoarchaeota archaeon]|nr:hypothetical protein [Nanoarchaeota archaeon]
MTQYLMREERDSENLKKIINKYEPLFFHVSPKFSGGIKDIIINENLKGKKLEFNFHNGLKFSSDKELIYFPLKNYHGLRVEYQSKKDSRIYPYDFYPNDSKMPEVKISTLRSVSDGLMFEIFFKGKIILEYDDLPENYKDLATNYWKIA